jgi:hypothetical protein
MRGPFQPVFSAGPPRVFELVPLSTVPAVFLALMYSVGSCSGEGLKQTYLHRHQPIAYPLLQRVRSNLLRHVELRAYSRCLQLAEL